MSFPDVSRLVPQSGPMLLLGRVLEHSDEATTCAVDIAHSALFREHDGSVPTLVGLEYMAQCAAAHGGLVARSRKRSPGMVLFLGSRRLYLRTDRFEPGRELRVTARHLRGESGLIWFEAAVREAGEDEPVVSGRLSLYAGDRAADLSNRAADLSNRAADLSSRVEDLLNGGTP